MKREARWFWAFFVGVGMAVGSGFLPAQVLGASRNPGCIQDAQEDYKDCVATCREFMQVEKNFAATWTTAAPRRAGSNIKGV